MLLITSLLSMKNLWARPPLLDIRASGVTPHMSAGAKLGHRTPRERGFAAA
jgi:hypothetical protein